jgi:hypothetical protein
MAKAAERIIDCTGLALIGNPCVVAGATPFLPSKGGPVAIKRPAALKCSYLGNMNVI